MWPASTNGDAVPIVRKQDGTLVVGVRITLKPGRDDDLIDLVLSAQKLAPAIREAMRSGVVKEAFTELETDIGDLAAAGIEL
jgi:hypothetical protein